MEILSPVKNLLAAKAVIQNGADAIYFGSPSFSARSKVNLDLNEIKEIINYANGYGVKSYVAFNIVIFEDEINNFLKQIVDVYNIGATGIILQDISMAKMIKDICPELEIHASTQMNIMNSDAVKLLKENDFSRVVVPREMTFERIKNLKSKNNIEIEAFIHGALCVSYSGQCFDSVLLDSKSANRGRCSQYCRVEQSIMKNGNKVIDLDFPLNLKDLNNVSEIEQYISSGVDSLKIEGRLKGIDYGSLVTNAYKQKDESIDLQKVYNRTFTNGLISKTKSSELVNNVRANNVGKQIGLVVSCEKVQKSYYNYVIKIETKEEINKLDNLRYILNEEETGQIVEQVERYAGGYKIYSKVRVDKNAVVYKTKDAKLIKEATLKANSFSRKLNIDLNIEVYKDIIYIYLFDDVLFLEMKMEEAINNSLKEEDIVKLFAPNSKSPYSFEVNVNYLESNVFLSSKDLKKIKKSVNQYVEDKYLVKRNSNYIKIENSVLKNNNQTNFIIEVKSEEQYEVVKDLDYKLIVNNIDLALNIEPKSNVYISLPNIIYDDQMEIINEIVELHKNIVVSENGMYNRLKDTHNLITNFQLNITNSQQLNFYDKADSNILSVELNLERINSFANENSVVMAYGYIPVMYFDYCPINKNKQDGCKNCRLCRKNEYSLYDGYKEFKLGYENFDHLVMYSDLPIDYKDEIKNINVNTFLIKFSSENSQEVSDILDYYINDKYYKFNSIDNIIYKKVL